MGDRLDNYRRAVAPLPQVNRVWPLHGAGIDNLGRDGKPVLVPMPRPGSAELIVRFDACGLCASDTKVIRQGQAHPRIYHDLQSDPVVLGHEVSLTIVGVGSDLRDRYQVGDRFTLQPDIWVGGVNYAFGYEIKGGLAQYGIIDQRVLNGDGGNYLIPIQPGTGYSESALTEPWSCVVAAYQLKYRTSLRPGGTTWIVGSKAARRTGTYTVSAGLDQSSHPDRLFLTDVPPDFANWLQARAAEIGVETTWVADFPAPPVEQVDDIVVLGEDPELIEALSPHMADSGVMAIIAQSPLGRKICVDVGRVHYNGWLYVGTAIPDVAAAYKNMPVRSSLKPGGRAWYVGAGGPMGRMHVQYAIQAANAPGTLVCSDVSEARLNDLCATFSAEAATKGIQLLCLNPTVQERFETAMAPFKTWGFDDIIVLVPIPDVISEAACFLAPGGVLNIFAGASRGTLARLDLSDVYLRDVRVIGHTSSTIDDLRLTLQQTDLGRLSPNRAVAGIGSLSAARDGLQAVSDAVFPGKIVIYPHIIDFPLTPLPELKSKAPSVYAKLKNGREWTVEAEDEFLRLMLP